MSQNTLLSDGQRKVILASSELDLRDDGRSWNDYQPVFVERNVTHNCDGSAHVRCGHNDVMVGVKFAIEEVTQDEDFEWTGSGRVDFFADITANAAPEFEGKHGEEISNELVSLFSQAITPFLDLKSLVIIEKKYIVVIHVDIAVLECGSRPSLIDTASIAVKAALFDFRMPKVTIDTEANEFIVSDDVFEATPLDVTQVPLFVTLTRIGSRYLCDVTIDEEAASIASVTFAINESHGIVHIKKFGCGSLDIAPMREVMEEAKRIGVMANQALINKLMIQPVNTRLGKIAFTIL